MFQEVFSDTEFDPLLWTAFVDIQNTVKIGLPGHTGRGIVSYFYQGEPKGGLHTTQQTVL